MLISKRAMSLYEENVINELIPPRSSRGQSILEQVKKAVCDNYQKLEKFAAILQLSPSTMETGNDIMNEYSESKTFISNYVA